MVLNRVKQLLSDGFPAYGTFVFSSDPAVVEVIAASGFDFIIIDTEHAVLSIGDVTNLIRGAAGTNLTAFVRMGNPSPQALAQVLDSGAAGVVIPHVVEKKQVRKFAQSIRYPPLGIRGACTGVRATQYSAIPFSDYLSASNKEAWFIAQIEDPAAVEHIDEIIATPGIDVILPGPSDLAAAYGVPGQLTHPIVTEAVNRVLLATAQHQGVLTAMYLNDAADMAQWSSAGVRMFVYSIDYKVLGAAYRRAHQELHSSLRDLDQSTKGISKV